MEILKKIALISLLSCSAVCTNYCAKDHSKMTEEGYKAVAAFVAKQNWFERLKIAAAIKKLKDIDWSEVVKYLPWSK